MDPELRLLLNRLGDEEITRKVEQEICFDELEMQQLKHLQARKIASIRSELGYVLKKGCSQKDIADLRHKFRIR